MDAQFLDRRDGPKLAYIRALPADPDPALPGVMFLGGFRSDMTGSKATFLDAQCRARGQGFIRFDYGGHGQSAGRFEDGTIEQWRDDALAVLDRLSDGPVILIGSSMGGWIGLLLALARPERVKGYIGIAAAPDFTRTFPDRFDDVMRESFEARNFAEVPSIYSPEPYKVTRAMIDSGNRVCLLNGRHHLPIPVRLLQGLQDTEVPGTMPDRITDCLEGADILVDIIPDGDHSLSRPQDLALLDIRLRELTASICACT